MGRTLKDIVWPGDSLAALREFPKRARIDPGEDLRRLQRGELPLDSKRVTTVSRGARELRARDRSIQFRILYVLKKSNRIIVLHSFIKKTGKTRKSDVDVAKERLRLFDRD